MTTKSWKLSPSDMTFLWEECPRCFYLKVIYSFNRPQVPFPRIFGRIDRIMKEYYEGKSTQIISPDLPEGNVIFGERWVTSEPIALANHTSHCHIVGKIDSLVKFVDGSFGVIDFKTSEARPEHIPFYSRQLQAYAYALEHPAPGKLSLSPITKMGLICVEPQKMDLTEDGKIAYFGHVTWLEIPTNEDQFLRLIDQILFLLEQPIPPDSNPECGFCKYRDLARINSL